MNGTIFFAVDCQKDFINKDGKLPAPNAEAIKPALDYLSDLAYEEEAVTISTCDWHNATSDELSKTPNFIDSFPEHCLANSEGAEFISEVTPDDIAFSMRVGWDRILDQDLVVDIARETTKQYSNLVIRKDKFDVFEGNPNAGRIIDGLKENGYDVVICYGVATDFCVNYAVNGLAKRGFRVFVVIDAVKEISQDNLVSVVAEWKKLGVKFATTTPVTQEMKDTLPLVKLLENEIIFPVDEL